MRTLLLLLALSTIPLRLAAAQEPPAAPDGAMVSSAHVSGFDLGRLSPGLQQEIGGLAGAPLDRDRLGQLAARIEAEQPRFVAAVRATQDPDGEVRVVFVVAYRRAKDDQENVNARYVVEHVAVRGIRMRDLDEPLREDLQALIGKRLDSDEAEKVETRLRNAFPDHDVRRSILRGGQSGQIRLVFVVNKTEAARWLHFQPLRSKVVFHSDQGWSTFLDLPISSNEFRITPIVAIDNGDDLIEEFGGFGLRFETRKIGTERVGARLEWSTFEPSWRDATLAALASTPMLPGIYERRSTLSPIVRVAVSRHVSVHAGVSITELEAPADLSDDLMANAAVFGINYSQEWEPDSRVGHSLDADLTVRAGTETLESDYDYTRYLGQLEYQFRTRRHRVILSGMAGGIRRDAPLFERFSLGDSQTLRGWDKYDIAPAGGDRMFHTSLEYRYRGLGLFLDAGSVWDRTTDRKVRVATGFGFHPGPVFFTLGFPVNTDELRAVFTMGLRFSGIGIRKY